MKALAHALVFCIAHLFIFSIKAQIPEYWDSENSLEWNGKLLGGMNPELPEDFEGTESTYLLLTIDPKRSAIEGILELPSTGYGSTYRFALNPDNSFYFVLNSVVTFGPDHHDIHVYALSSSSQMSHHRHLRGESSLTRLFLGECQSDEKGNLTLHGNSDSPVDFIQPGQFIFPSQLDLSAFDGSRRFDFECTYSFMMKPLRLSIRTEDEIIYDYDNLDDEGYATEIPIPGRTFDYDFRSSNWKER